MSDIYHVIGKNSFDVIIVRDVLEHINNQQRFMCHIKSFLKSDGIIFFGFPPWQNPFGGHQQICKNPILSKLPYIHLLPKTVYGGILKAFGESISTVQFLLETKAFGISIERFNRIVDNEGYKVLKSFYYLINPNYEIKFKLKPKEQVKILCKIPYFRNFLITTCYVILAIDKDADVLH